jgi:hypothetical protein
MKFTKEAPEWAHVCDYTKERAEGYIEISQLGLRYFVPVTKAMKRIFGITRRGDKLIFSTDSSKRDAEEFLRDIVGGLVSQVQKTVGDAVEESLSSQLTTFLKEKLEPGFESMVGREMSKHLLPEGDSEGKIQ